MIELGAQGDFRERYRNIVNEVARGGAVPSRKEDQPEKESQRIVGKESESGGRAG